MENPITTNLVPDHAQILEARIARASARKTDAPFGRWSLYALYKWVDGQRTLPALDDPAYEEHFTYTDRESYLAWVAEWKATYAALSSAQREHKAAIRAAAGDLATQASEQAAHADGRKQARALLAIRAAAKLDSWAKRNALKEQAAANA